MPTSKSHSLQLRTEPPLQRTVNSMCPTQYYLTIICLILRVKAAENLLGTRKYEETKIIWRDTRFTHWPGAFVQRGICFVCLLKRERMDRMLTSFISLLCAVFNFHSRSFRFLLLSSPSSFLHFSSLVHSLYLYALPIYPSNQILYFLFSMQIHSSESLSEQFFFFSSHFFFSTLPNPLF